MTDVVYEPLQRYLRRRLPSGDVDELLNDTLLVIWRRLDSVPDDDPLPWSYGVAKRCLANHRRASGRRLRLVSKLGERATRQDTVVDPPSGEVENPRLEAALRGLDEEERELVRLWAWEQLEPREIAIVLDMTPNAVSLRLTRVKKKIFSEMERQNAGAAGQVGLGHGKEQRT